MSFFSFSRASSAAEAEKPLRKRFVWPRGAGAEGKSDRLARGVAGGPASFADCGLRAPRPADCGCDGEERPRRDMLAASDVETALMPIGEVICPLAVRADAATSPGLAYLIGLRVAPTADAAFLCDTAVATFCST
jgi:hypothetical protein